MTAVDTNVVVRLLTADDTRHTARASALFGTEEIWLSKTVILETEWVLRSLCRFRGTQISAAMLALMSLPNVRDALHLASKGESDKFATFDEKLVKRANELGVSGAALLRV
jgi:predicted nucleic acid-binding protein